jgi:hypothetical protein
VSIEYRIFNATKGITIDNTTRLFSVDEYSVAPDGNCLEATFRCVPKGLVDGFGNPAQVSVRDTIFIQTRPVGGTFTNKWFGFITLAGNPRSDNVETFRAIGLKQRFYETILGMTPFIAAGDVGTMANTVLDGALLSVASIDLFTFPSGNRDIPTVGFQNGVRYPLAESAGDALDALAATVGQFVVPTSTTYTYDGITYNAGDVVPPITWGVRADPTSNAATFFFRRLAPSIGTYNETDLNVDVTWPAISGEEVVNGPVLQYFPNMDWSVLGNPRIFGTNPRGLTLPVAQPMLWSLQLLGQIQRLVQVPNPSDYLEELTGFTVAPNGTMSSINNAFNGNPANSADGTNAQLIEYQAIVAAAAQAQTVTPAQAVVRLDIEYGDTIGFFVDIGQRATQSSPFESRAWRARYTQNTLESTGRIRLDLPVLPPLEFLEEAATINVDFYSLEVNVTAIPGPNGSGGTLRVFDMRPFAPSTPSSFVTAKRLAESYQRLAAQEVTDVKVFGDEARRTRIDLTPEVGSVIEVPVERIQYSITTAEGITTTYHAGQAYDGELVSERVVLEGLARRAVRSNG